MCRAPADASRDKRETTARARPIDPSRHSPLCDLLRLRERLVSHSQVARRCVAPRKIICRNGAIRVLRFLHGGRGRAQLRQQLIHKIVSPFEVFIRRDRDQANADHGNPEKPPFLQCRFQFRIATPANPAPAAKLAQVNGRSISGCRRIIRFWPKIAPSEMLNLMLTPRAPNSGPSRGFSSGFFHELAASIPLPTRRTACDRRSQRCACRLVISEFAAGARDCAALDGVATTSNATASAALTIHLSIRVAKKIESHTIHGMAAPAMSAIPALNCRPLSIGRRCALSFRAIRNSIEGSWSARQAKHVSQVKNADVKITAMAKIACIMLAPLSFGSFLRQSGPQSAPPRHSAPAAQTDREVPNRKYPRRRRASDQRDPATRPG